MSDLNEGVGKKIVEALKKQTELEARGIQDKNPAALTDDFGLDPLSMGEINNQGLLASNYSNIGSVSDDAGGFKDLFADDNNFEEISNTKTSFDNFLNSEERVPDVSSVPSNILILKKLISQLPNGVTRHTGAQIIKQTMEALGISMKSVLSEAQEVQNNLKESSKECQMLIQEYKRKISILEKQTQNYQKQYGALNDLISLFIQTTK